MAEEQIFQVIFFLILKKNSTYILIIYLHNKAVSKLYKKYIKSNILATGAMI